jgi:hypothetical protein
MPRGINESADAIDLRPRVVTTTTIVGSPAAAAETIVAQTPAIGDVAVLAGVLLVGSLSFIVGTNGTAATVRLRQTNLAGTVIASSGALVVAATNPVAPALVGFDAAAVPPAQVYVLTLQITAGSAASTVSATTLAAVVL